MNQNTYKIIGIVSSVIIIILFLNNLIRAFSETTSYSGILSTILTLVQIICIFLVLYSGSQLIKEYDPVNIDTFIYLYLAAKLVSFTLFHFAVFFAGIIPFFSTLLYLFIYAVLAIIAIKLLKIKNNQINISYFKSFILSYLILLLLYNTFNHFFISKISVNLSHRDIISIMKKLYSIFVVPFIFALMFFLKPVNRQINNNSN